ncbi:MAG: ABC transporter permease subunit [Chloroflexi bacterium]|nr:ABC transporter permease subunit [Chloroflexota bacterium]MDA1272091.1 ABC transporter permease subunit [Chloroflexota bacterium]
MTQRAGELFDLGYQHYDGPREGRWRGRKAVFMDGFRTTLGLGRGAVSKVLPILLFGIPMGISVIFVLINSLSQGQLDLPGHSDYYQIVSIILLIFAAIIAPELLCSDRRNGVISLYLVRPLSVTDYLAARWLAFFAITLLLVYSGQLVLLVGLILSSVDPMDYLRENWLDIPRILGAGFLLAAFITTLPLAVSAFTDRRAFAAAFVIGLFVISAPVGAALTECDQSHGSFLVEQCEPVTGDAGKWLGLVDVSRVPTNVNNMIFDTEDEGRRARLTAELPRIVPIGWYVVLTGGMGLVLWLRYRRLTV